MQIQHNTEAIQSTRYSKIYNTQWEKDLEKLSTGKRINNASDDAAGLAVSNKIKAQALAYKKAKQNIQDGISMIQNAEAGLAEISNMLQRIRDLAVQSANDTLTASDRNLIDMEVQQLLGEVDRMASTVQFNTMKLLNEDNIKKIHTAANESQTVTLFFDKINTQVLNINTVNIKTRDAAEAALPDLDTAINTLTLKRAKYGAQQNRLEAILNVASESEMDQTASVSRIEDTDIAKQTIELTKHQIISRSSQQAIKFSSAKTNIMLSLLQGAA